MLDKPLFRPRIRLLESVIIQHRDGSFTCVPKGFCFDGLSLPMGNPFSSFLYAGMWHDWEYFLGVISKQMADDGFKVIMEDSPRSTSLLSKIDPILAEVYHFAVEVAGGSAWDAHRNNDTDPDTLKRKNMLIATSARDLDTFLNKQFEITL